MKNLVLRLDGISPLLIHSTAAMNKPTNEGLINKSDYPTGRDEAEIGVYRDQGGGLVFPTIAIVRSLWDAGSGVKIGKLTARRALAGLVLLGEFTPVLDPDSGKQLVDFDVDTRFVRVGTARIPRSRAKLPEWCLEVPVQYDENLLTSRAIEDLLNRAGSLIGVGDYRPATGGGPFGRFRASVSAA